MGQRAAKDWALKYPRLPNIRAIVSWADDVHHEGTIYRAANFTELGKSGGAQHGAARRRNGGNDKLNPDYLHPKTLYMRAVEAGLTFRKAGGSP